MRIYSQKFMRIVEDKIRLGQSCTKLKTIPRPNSSIDNHFRSNLIYLNLIHQKNLRFVLHFRKNLTITDLAGWKGPKNLH